MKNFVQEFRKKNQRNVSTCSPLARRIPAVTALQPSMTWKRPTMGKTDATSLTTSVFQTSTWNHLIKAVKKIPTWIVIEEIRPWVPKPDEHRTVNKTKKNNQTSLACLLQSSPFYIAQLRFSSVPPDTTNRKRHHDWRIWCHTRASSILLSEKISNS